jgi:hypothetical protein
MKLLKFTLLSAIILLISCDDKTKELTTIKKKISLIKVLFAPDKRVELFDLNVKYSNKKFILEGETTSLVPYFKVKNILVKYDGDYINKVRVLPDSAVGNMRYAVARNSVINIRSQPKHSAELGTQGLLGMNLRVLDKKGDFYRVQTPDNYISWVDKGGITKMNSDEFDAWYASEKIIYTQNFGYVFTDLNFKEIVSDITLGGMLKLIKNHKKYYEVEYPDKRKGYIKKNEAAIYNAWTKNLAPNDLIKTRQNNIETIAKSMDGFPYLWGGTSSKGMDCSGFTKMVYLMNGFIIPRDASQQINAGVTVDKDLTFEGLEKGDLLFFGRKATLEKGQRVTHVGLWLGNDKMEFIHASGNVHLNSMDLSQPNYDAFNKNRYLGGKRYLGVKDDKIFDLKKKIKL